MSRVSSSRSSGSSLSQVSHLSSMDLTGNASTYGHGSQAGSALGGIDTTLFLDSDSDAITSQMYWPGYSLDVALNTDATFSIPEASPIHVVPANMQLGPDVNLAETSPGSWDCFSSSISRSSSPATIDELWLQTQSPNSSPELQCQSPRYVLHNHRETNGADSYHPTSISLDRKISVIPEDLKIIPQLDENLALPPAYTPRRQPTEGESARDHDLYKKATPFEDGLYHCPWEGQANCNHKPEKLKCNYE